MRKILLIIGFISILPLALLAQVLDGAYAREHVAKRKAINYQYIRETDAQYSKKVLRYLDLDEKINHPLYFPVNPIDYPDTNKNGIAYQPNRKRVNLIELIYDEGLANATELGLTAFNLDPNDLTNWWRTEIDGKKLESVMWFKYVNYYDAGGGVVLAFDDSTLIQKRDVKGYMFWEEWVFDKQRSVMDVRIVAMAPIANVNYSVSRPDQNGNLVGRRESEERKLFWIPFPDFRPLFASYEVFNTTNDAERRTFDDVFFKRRFSSYIMAETNNYDNRLISDYLMGIDALREGEIIQERLFLYEHDQWEY